MSSKTTNFELHKIDLTDAPPDITVLNQNWDKLDVALIPNKVYPAVGTHNQYTGSVYAVSVPGVTELYAGLRLTIIPDSTCVIKYCYLNVNELGKKYLCLPTTSATSSSAYGTSNDWISADYPIEVLYDGSRWLVLNISVPNGEHLLGTLPIKSGGTGANTAANARTNLEVAQAVPDTAYPDCYYREGSNGQEWINPPLETGNVYQTTERIGNTPIYKKRSGTSILYSYSPNSVAWYAYTGNKPTGTYTGNGSSASRTINTGVMSDAIIIWADGIYGYMSLVTPQGIICKDTATVEGGNSGVAYFEDGVLHIASSNPIYNDSGRTYHYQVL